MSIKTFAMFRLVIALFDEVNSGDCERASPALARAKFFEQTLAKGKRMVMPHG
jgi:hypothetical protein